MADEEKSPDQQAQQAFERAEARVAKATERLVARPSFGELLALVTENVIGLTRIGNDAADLALRNLRLVGRRDVIALQRQLARTEDKLERVLQELERLEERLGERETTGASTARRARTQGNGARRSRSTSKPRTP